MKFLAHILLKPSLKDLSITLLACEISAIVWQLEGFAGGSDGKESAHNVGDQGSVPGLGRYSRQGNGNTLQYSFLPGEFHGQRS